MIQMKEPWERRKGKPVEQKTSLSDCKTVSLQAC